MSSIISPTGIGMRNLGNTCCLNAVVKSFMHTAVLLRLLKTIDKVSQFQSKYQLKIFSFIFYPFLFFLTLCVLCIIRELIDFSTFFGRFFVSLMELVIHMRSISKPNYLFISF
uniref:Peptidase C19 ubiquitin carboxyl-terminal hydrolase domain-containing protein n=1 Tax=Solanum lycopersicum TaxID=4081 RepID=A0A3Q7I1M8_SOLLC